MPQPTDLDMYWMEKKIATLHNEPHEEESRELFSFEMMEWKK